MGLKDLGFGVSIEEINQLRIWFYSFLSQRYYQPPNATALQEIKSSYQIFNAFYGQGEQEGLNCILKYIEHLDEQSEEEEKELFDDYQALFIGPRIKAFPWESVYRSREGLLFQEETLKVREYYGRFGLEVARLHNEPDDHIGLELEFMAHLSLKVKRELEEDSLNIESILYLLEGQFSFLKEHPMQWIDAFCSRVEENAKTPFYIGLALFTPYFLEIDIALLEGLIDEIKEMRKSDVRR